SAAGHQQRIASYSRDADGRIRSVTSPRGNATSDPNDFTTSYGYYADGDLRTIGLPTRGLPHESAIQTIKIRRNEVGDPVAIQDARGNPSNYATLDQNTFYDTGGLRSTTMPWMWKVALSPDDDQ